MVSIRRPNKSKQQSLFTIRNVVLLFIVLQTINLASKMIGKTDEPNLISALEDIQKRKGNQAPPPDIKIEHIPEDQPHEDIDVHSDHQELPEVFEEDNPAAVVDEEPDVVNPVDEHEDKPIIDEIPNELDEHNEVVIKKHGTGPTKLGYVVDLVEARNNAAFRKAAVIEPKGSQKVGRLTGDEETTFQPCDYFEDRRWMQHKECRDKDTRLVAYNTASFPRTFCGNTIPPGGAVKLEEHCEEPVHVFPNEQDAPFDGNGMPPIVVQSKTGDAVSNVDDVACDVPCKFETGLTGHDRFIAGTPWKIYHTDEDPYLTPSARIERTAFRFDHYYSTTSFRSSVPLSFYSFDKYNFRKAHKMDFDSLENKATYLLDSDCNSSPIRRQKWFSAVAAAVDTESYGSCQHSKDLGPGEDLSTADGREHLYQKNRIALAFEAGSEKDHVTNIVWEALMAGVVPVILGASNLPSHLPQNCAIFTGSFNNWDKLAEFVKKVSEDKKLWESFHEWRTNEAQLKAFEERFDFTKTAPECRTCRWAYAKKYGLGWDHSKQVVKENWLKRQLCVDKSAELALKPFREVWVGSSKVADEASGETCPTYGSKQDATIHVKDAIFHRTISHHDGVTDMELSHAKDVSEDVVLRIEVPVRNTEGAFFRNTHTFVEGPSNPIISSATIQDNRSRVTVLANWETTVISPEEGAIEIHFQPVKSSDDELRRVRIITEDMNELHGKLTEFFPSSFGKMMTEDFIKPLEIYFAGLD